MVKKPQLIAPVNPWKIEVYVIKSNRPHFISVYQRSKRLQMLGNHSEKKKKTSRVVYLASKLIERVMNKGDKFLKKLWCCVGVRV